MALINKQKGRVGDSSENSEVSIVTQLTDGEMALQHNTKELVVGTKDGNITFVPNTTVHQDITNQLNALAPYSGSLQVAKKLDTFDFYTDAGNTYKVTDNTEFIKMGDKVINTGPQTIDYSNDMPDVVEVITDGSNVASVDVSAGEHVVDCSELTSDGGFDTGTGWTAGTGWTIGSGVATSTGVTDSQLSTEPATFDGLQCKAKFEVTSYTSGTLQYYTGSGSWTDIDSTLGVHHFNYTAVLASRVYLRNKSGDEFIGSIDNISVTRVSDTFRAIQDTPIGTALTDTSYFQDRDYVSNQVLASHSYNTLTSSYEGIKTDIMFNDVDLESTLDIDFIMTNNGFSKVSEYLYSKGSYYVAPIGLWQSLNKGGYEPFLNIFGTAYFGTGQPWYGNVDNSSTSETFVDLYDSGNVGRPNQHPQSKYYDIVYKDQFIDLRCWAKILSPADKKLIAEDKIENGVQDTVVMQISYEVDTSSSVDIYIKGLSDSDDYINKLNVSIGDYIVYFDNGITPVVRVVEDMLSQPASSQIKITLDSAVTRASGFWYYTTTKPILSSGTSLSIDLIGSPDNYPQVLKDRLASGKGVIGVNPLLVGQDGTSYIGAVNKEPILANKFIVPFSCQYLTLSNDTWTALALSTDSVLNKIDQGLNVVDYIYVQPYTSSNNPLVQCDPKQVTLVEPKAIASNSYSIYKGAKIGNQVSGKIATGNGSNGYESRVLENGEIGVTHVASAGTFDWKYGETILIDTDTSIYKGKTLYRNQMSTGTTNWSTYFTDANVDYLLGTGLYWFIDSPAIGTTPQHSTLALDNSNSSASKHFFVEEKDSNGNCLVGVYGEEMVWDFDMDSGGDFVNVSVDTNYAYTEGTLYYLNHTGFGKLYQYVVIPTSSYSKTAFIMSYRMISYIGGKNVLMDTSGNIVAEIWDGNGFGDDNQFNQLTNGTETDLNGNTVRTFHGSIALNGKDI